MGEFNPEVHDAQEILRRWRHLKWVLKDQVDFLPQANKDDRKRMTRFQEEMTLGSKNKNN